eukprot:6182465-Pleurochrysis_carterae.AAC.2
MWAISVARQSALNCLLMSVACSKSFLHCVSFFANAAGAGIEWERFRTDDPFRPHGFEEMLKLVDSNPPYLTCAQSSEKMLASQLQ